MALDHDHLTMAGFGEGHSASSQPGKVLMESTVKTVSAGDFKARCLSLLDEVAETRLPLVVTKRGKAVARLVPMTNEIPSDLIGSVRYASEEDLLSPVGEVWDAER